MSGLTVDTPVKLAQAIASNRVIPGDTLILLDGTYTGDWVCSLVGTLAAPIAIKPLHPGLVTIDGTFKFGSHVHVYDINFTDTRPERLFQYYGTEADEAITMSGVGNRMHGCIVTQQRTSGVNWFSSEGENEGEISENIFLLNGNRFEDGSGHGHSIYSHNNTGGARLIARNAFYLNLGDYTLHLYSASNLTDDFVIQDNVFLGHVFCGGHFGPNNLLYQRNINYNKYLSIATGMGTHICDGITIDANTLINLGYFAVGGDPGVLTSLTETNNIVYGGKPESRDGYAFTEIPATFTKLTAFTKSARWKGLLSIFNRDSAASVAVDFSSVLSAGSYKLRNTQNITETWEFEYTSGSVNVPTNFTSGEFIGDAYVPATTFPVFGAFVIEAA